MKSEGGGRHIEKDIRYLVEVTSEQLLSQDLLLINQKHSGIGTTGYRKKIGLL